MEGILTGIELLGMVPSLVEEAMKIWLIWEGMQDGQEEVNLFVVCPPLPPQWKRSVQVLLMALQNIVTGMGLVISCLLIYPSS